MRADLVNTVLAVSGNFNLSLAEDVDYRNATALSREGQHEKVVLRVHLKPFMLFLLTLILPTVLVSEEGQYLANFT